MNLLSTWPITYKQQIVGQTAWVVCPHIHTQEQVRTDVGYTLANQLHILVHQTKICNLPQYYEVVGTPHTYPVHEPVIADLMCYYHKRTIKHFKKIVKRQQWCKKYRNKEEMHSGQLVSSRFEHFLVPSLCRTTEHLQVCQSPFTKNVTCPVLTIATYISHTSPFNGLRETL